MNNVAILMPTYQGIKYINQQIQSIIKQKKINLTLFISVDPSSDGTYDFLVKLSKSIKNIKIIKHYNNFGTPTKNFFNLISNVDVNKFDYIGLADHDDVWKDDKVINGINILKKNKVECYSSSIIAFRNDKKKYINKSYNQTKYDYYFESAGPGSTYLFKSTFIKKFQRFLKNNKNSWNFKHYDWLIYSYARENNYKWYIDKNPTLYYRQHSNNFTGANWGFKALLARIFLVISGEAFKQSEHLSRIIKYKKNFFKNNLFYVPNFLLRTNKFRRKISERILLSIYFLFIFIFGKFENRTLKFSIMKVFRITILIASIFSIFYLLKEIQSKNFLLNKQILFLFYLINLSLLISISLRFFIFFEKLSIKKIKFFDWFIIFIESQIISTLIPYSNVIYRGYILKTKINLNITKYLFLTFFILLIENLYLFSILFVILFHYLNLKMLLAIIFLIFIMTLLFININISELLIYSFQKINRLFKFFNSRIFNFQEIEELSIVKKFATNDIINFNILVIIKLLLNFLSYFFIAKFMNLELSLTTIFLISSLNQLFEIVKITPQNIGLLELVNGFFFAQMLNLSIQDGIIFKLNHRIFEVFSLILTFIILKIYSYIVLFSKKRNIPLHND